MLAGLRKLLRRLIKLAKNPGIVFVEEHDGREVRREYIVVRQSIVPRPVRHHRATPVPSRVIRPPQHKPRVKPVLKPIVYRDVGRPILEEWFNDGHDDRNIPENIVPAPVPEVVGVMQSVVQAMLADISAPSRFDPDEEPTIEDLQQEAVEEDEFLKGVEADFQEVLQEYGADD